MIPSLCWKDYREQRSLWLAILFLALLLALYVGLFLPPSTHAGGRDFLRDAVTGILFSLMLAQGVVCGAQLLAGEKETGTLAILDILASQRYPIWRTKLVVGTVLTLTQALVLSSVVLVLKLGSWSYVPSFILLGWLALLWGMVGGALCEHVFTAVLSGIVLAVGSLGLAVMLPLGVTVVEVILAVVALLIAKQSFCAADYDRRARSLEGQATRRVLRPGARQSLLWLAFRQGRWVLGIGLALSLLASFFVSIASDVLWPGLTWLIGLVCGLAVFSAEQIAEQERFLGAQRLPPGKVWWSKSVFWALSAAAMVTVLSSITLTQHDRVVVDYGHPMFHGMLSSQQRPWLFVTLWAVHGFAFGQFCALLSRKTVVASVLGAGLSLFVLALWVAPLTFGSVEAWQVLAVPLLLLVATRLSVWTWFCGRLYTPRHVARLAVCGLAASAWLVGVLWYRAGGVPDVGEPFDVTAVEAKVSEAARNPTSAQLRRGLRQMMERNQQVLAELGPPRGALVPDAGNKRSRRPLLVNSDYFQECDQILREGWPEDDRDLGRWLDAMFAAGWVDDVRAARSRPLALLLQPRDQQRTSERLREIDNVRECAGLLTVRALQLQAKGEAKTALEHLDTVLDLSLHVRRYAAALATGMASTVGEAGLSGLDHWLDRVGRQAELLTAARDVLLRHEADLPPLVENVEAEYLSTQENLANQALGNSRLGPYLAEFALTPWERERQLRLLRAVMKRQCQLAQLTPAQVKELKGTDAALDFWSHWAFEGGLPLEARASESSRQAWGQVIQESPVAYAAVQMCGYMRRDYAKYLRSVRVRQVYLGLALYQHDNGRAAATLEDLVPRYLKAVPLDPAAQRSFGYKVSTGEELPVRSPGSITPHPQKLLPGQGVLWSEPDPEWRTSGDGEMHYLPVPAWK